MAFDQTALYTSMKALLLAKGLITQESHDSPITWTTEHMNAWHIYAWKKGGLSHSPVPWSDETIPAYLTDDPDFSYSGGGGSTPPPPNPPTFTPVVVAISGFTAATPSVATVSTTDAAKLKNGDLLRLSAAAGDPAAIAAVNGVLATVAGLAGTTFSATGLALAAVDVTALTATGTTEAPPAKRIAPVVQPKPAPAPVKAAQPIQPTQPVRPAPAPTQGKTQVYEVKK
jgi:hypothetical protein